MKSITLTLSVAAALLLAGCKVPSSNSGLSCEGGNQIQSNMLVLVNQARAQGRWCGGVYYDPAPAVVWNITLANAAWSHSDDMAYHNFFSHTGSDGLQVWDRVVARGYNYSVVGENIHAGTESSASAMSNWIDSPGHCANIMDPDFTEVGAACVDDSGTDYGTYWTQVFGTPW